MIKRSRPGPELYPNLASAWTSVGRVPTVLPVEWKRKEDALNMNSWGRQVYYLPRLPNSQMVSLSPTGHRKCANVIRCFSAEHWNWFALFSSRTDNHRWMRRCLIGRLGLCVRCCLLLGFCFLQLLDSNGFELGEVIPIHRNWRNRNQLNVLYGSGQIRRASSQHNKY